MKHKLKKHHAKPVRKRHILTSLLSLVVLAAAVYLLGAGATEVARQLSPEPTYTGERLQAVRSSLGYSTLYDASQLRVDTVASNSDSVVDQPADDPSLVNDQALVEVSFTPRPELADQRTKASSLQIVVEPELSEEQLASGQGVLGEIAELYRPSSTARITYSLADKVSEQIDGVTFERRVYFVDSDLGGELGTSRTFSTQWVAVVSGRPLIVTLKGLVGDSAIPEPYATVIESLSFDTNASELLGLNRELLGSNDLDQYAEDVLSLQEQYLADLVSPAVVKVYTAVCGKLAVNQVVQSNELCNGVSGSGFIISSDGYIATNGHVVSYEAEDLIADLLLTDTSFLLEFLNGAGLDADSAAQVVTSPDLLAGVVAAVYSTPENTYTLENRRERTLVAIGDDAIDFSDAAKFFAKQTSTSVKQADIIDIDYSSADLYADASEGFSSSDVALLKISVTDSPYILLADELPLANEEISVVGFPDDAENSLVDKRDLVVSVTNGTVSSVRDAVGSNSKLIQSDVDASSGNSGGPAINTSAEAIGLLTYRFKSDQVSDASKSYMREIGDLRSLLERNNVTLKHDGDTQQYWLEGLDYFSTNRFSKAIDRFEEVKISYPAHRLSSAYIQRSERAIANGEEVRDLNVPLIIGLAGFGGLLLVISLLWMIRHHKLHILHREHYPPGPPTNQTPQYYA
ncbi:MAG: serine protease [Patescibacteria group bacterium]